MKRDMDLIRKIMLTLEEDGDVYFESYERHIIEHHVYLLGEAGLLITADITPAGSKHKLAVAGSVSPITWNGHAFIDTIRDDNWWNKAKKSLSGMSLSHIVTWCSTKCSEGLSEIGDLL